MVRLAIISTHPIQYNSPLYELLKSRNKIEFKVFYTWGEEVTKEKYDPGFKRNVAWDIPLLDGYNYSFVRNVSRSPGTHHFSGIDNPTLVKEIQDWKADFILVNGWNYKSHLGLLRFFKGRVPVIFRGDSTLLDERRGVKTILRRIFLTWIYRHVDYALYVGENNKRYFLAHGVASRKLRRAPHSIDNKRFSRVSPEDEIRRKEWRAEMNFSEDDFILEFAGKLEEKKNPQYLIRLAKELKDYPHIKFLIVGNGHLEDVIKQQTKDDDRFYMLPFQNQSVMPLVYRLADAFILPSVGPGETWGLALNEAMASGLPVLASSKCGGAIDLIENHANGLVFEPGDTKAVKDYIVELATQPGLKEKSGQISKERVEKFNFAAVAEALEAICNHKL